MVLTIVLLTRAIVDLLALALEGNDIYEQTHITSKNYNYVLYRR